MCLIEDIEEEGCVSNRAGIDTLQVAQCAAVDEITFDPVTQEVLSITMDGTHPNPNFYTIKFEKDTGSFAQEMTKNKSSQNWVQTLIFIKPKMSATLRRQISSLTNCCCYVGVLLDNNNERHLTGVTYFPDTNTWKTEDFKVTAVSANTGADSTADSNESIVTMTANVGQQAPILDSAVVVP